MRNPTFAEKTRAFLDEAKRREALAVAEGDTERAKRMRGIAGTMSLLLALDKEYGPA